MFEYDDTSSSNSLEQISNGIMYLIYFQITTPNMAIFKSRSHVIPQFQIHQ